MDVAIDYKAGSLADAMKAAAPEGVDFYYDNTGGAILETAIGAMRIGGRIGLCGIVSQLSGTPEAGIRGVPLSLIVKRIGMQGFLLSDYSAQQRGVAERTLSAWADSGKLKVATHVLDGFDRIPDGLMDVLSGRNRGKAMVRL